MYFKDVFSLFLTYNRLISRFISNKSSAEAASCYNQMRLQNCSDPEHVPSFRHEAERLEQEARGRLERQKICQARPGRGRESQEGAA